MSYHAPEQDINLKLAAPEQIINFKISIPKQGSKLEILVENTCCFVPKEVILSTVGDAHCCGGIS